MKFDPSQYTIESIILQEKEVCFRAFRQIVYVERPKHTEFQSMNIFIPEVYFNGETLNGYTAETAPIFMPNTVGGYMPGKLIEPELRAESYKEGNTILRALQQGYVVVIPALRGRSQTEGKAPACIVDYKAAVRYLRHIKDEIPGNTERIITNGTSAGGALSALIGATGNSSDYEVYLEELGAEKERDDVFAVSCYCPITNLEHADMAYEWQFNKIYDYHRKLKQIDEEGKVYFTSIDNRMSDLQIQISKEQAELFPGYLNSLKLRTRDGILLTLDKEGNGSFKEYIKTKILESAQEAINQGEDLTLVNWLTVKENQVIGMDFIGYVQEIRRMKTTPAFDEITMSNWENSLFGNSEEEYQHFTKYSYEHSKVDRKMADEKIIKMMNPMAYIDLEESMVAKHWRIRHGECDRDTSLAISAILALALEKQGIDVDYTLPWGITHAGDYDLEALFKWIDKLCKEEV